MKHIEVRIKKLSEDASMPIYSKHGDAGMDLTATSIFDTDMYIEYGTGLALEIPLGFVGLIYPRSSLSNYDLVLSNHVGVVDSGFRGEIKLRFKKTDYVRATRFYKVGDRIGQIIIMPHPTVVFTEA